jgi:putative ABC transport system permease protein
MDNIFGASVENIAVVLGVIFVVLLGFLAFISWRDPILVRMSVRNVARRPVRGSLIILGLMLATAIISASFTVGDSITFSIKRSATDSLRALDEIVNVDRDADRWVDKAVPELFSQEVFDEIAPLLEADKDIDGIAPVLVEPIAVMNFRTNQFDTGSLMTGVGVSDVKTFEPLFGLDGSLADLDSLSVDELFIDKDGAEALAAERGDVLSLVLGPGNIREMKIRAVVDGWYFKRENTSVVLMAPLVYVQNFLGKEGELSGIIISNRGDEFQGEKLTPDIISRYGTLPVIKDAGLEIYPIKSDIIEQANAAGNLFVSFFTTFGLFSIGVGLLLIFLIFSMLAAERLR